MPALIGHSKSTASGHPTLPAARMRVAYEAPDLWPGKPTRENHIERETLANDSIEVTVVIAGIGVGLPSVANIRNANAFLTELMFDLAERRTLCY